MTNSISILNTNNDSLTYKLLQTQNSVISALKRYRNYEIVRATESDIDYMLDYISENNDRILSLLKNKKSAELKIQSFMDFSVFYKKTLTKSQMKLYKEYMSTIQKEIPIIKNSFKFICNKKYINELSNLILSPTDNNNQIYDILNSIIIYQNDSIKSIAKITNKANKFIKTI